VNSKIILLAKIGKVEETVLKVGRLRKNQRKKILLNPVKQGKKKVKVRKLNYFQPFSILENKNNKVN
jgi:hypothetical protein